MSDLLRFHSVDVSTLIVLRGAVRRPARPPLPTPALISHQLASVSSLRSQRSLTNGTRVWSPQFARCSPFAMSFFFTPTGCPVSDVTEWMSGICSSPDICPPYAILTTFLTACSLNGTELNSGERTVCNNGMSEGGSVAKWLACWTQAQKGLGSNRSRDAVG